MFIMKVYSTGERRYLCKNWEWLLNIVSVLYKATMIKIINTLKPLAVIASCLGSKMKIQKNTDSSQIGNQIYLIICTASIRICPLFLNVSVETTSWAVQIQPPFQFCCVSFTFFLPLLATL